jgi:hypothetical protein
MRLVRYRVSSNVIKKANRNLVVKGIPNNLKNSYNGVITTNIIIDGVPKVREISKEKIHDAYSKSLEEYAKKL